MVDVPTTDDVKDSASGGAVPGLAAGIGESVGRSVLGSGIGTAIGAVAAGSMLDGGDRDMVATLGVERGVNELMAGSSGSDSSRGRM